MDDERFYSAYGHLWEWSAATVSHSTPYRLMMTMRQMCG